MTLQGKEDDFLCLSHSNKRDNMFMLTHSIRKVLSSENRKSLPDVILASKDYAMNGSFSDRYCQID